MWLLKIILMCMISWSMADVSLTQIPISLKQINELNNLNSKEFTEQYVNLITQAGFSVAGIQCECTPTPDKMEIKLKTPDGDELTLDEEAIKCLGFLLFTAYQYSIGKNPRFVPLIIKITKDKEQDGLDSKVYVFMPHVTGDSCSFRIGVFENKDMDQKIQNDLNQLQSKRVTRHENAAFVQKINFRSAWYSESGYVSAPSLQYSTYSMGPTQKAARPGTSDTIEINKIEFYTSKDNRQQAILKPGDQTALLNLVKNHSTHQRNNIGKGFQNVFNPINRPDAITAMKNNAETLQNEFAQVGSQNTAKGEIWMFVIHFSGTVFDVMASVLTIPKPPAGK